LLTAPLFVRWYRILCDLQSLTKSLEELPSRASQLLIQWVAPVFTVVVVTVQQFIIIHHHRLSAKATQTG